jgi:hypothetical protein
MITIIYLRSTDIIQFLNNATIITMATAGKLLLIYPDTVILIGVAHADMKYALPIHICAMIFIGKGLAVKPGYGPKAEDANILTTGAGTAAVISISHMKTVVGTNVDKVNLKTADGADRTEDMGNLMTEVLVSHAVKNNIITVTAADGSNKAMDNGAANKAASKIKTITRVSEARAITGADNQLTKMAATEAALAVDKNTLPKTGCSAEDLEDKQVTLNIYLEKATMINGGLFLFCDIQKCTGWCAPWKSELAKPAIIAAH